jgi:hypothetical protein
MKRQKLIFLELGNFCLLKQKDYHANKSVTLIYIKTTGLDCSNRFNISDLKVKTI